MGACTVLKDDIQLPGIIFLLHHRMKMLPKKGSSQEVKIIRIDFEVEEVQM